MSGIYDYIVQSFPYTLKSKSADKSTQLDMANNDMANNNDISDITKIKNIKQANTFHKSVADTISYMIEDNSTMLVDLVA